MIDLTIHHENLAHNIRKARENRVVIPTYRQMKHPETIPGVIRDRLKAVGLWDVGQAARISVRGRRDRARQAQESRGGNGPQPAPGYLAVILLVSPS